MPTFLPGPAPQCFSREEVGVPETAMGPVRHTVVEPETGLHVAAYEVHDGRAVIEGDWFGVRVQADEPRQVPRRWWLSDAG